MSYYRKRRSSGSSYRKKTAAGQLIVGILAVFLLVPLLFSLGDLRSELPIDPSVSVNDPPVDPTVPTDPPEPVYESGYLLYQIDDGTGIKQYLNIRDTSTGGSLKNNPADACLFVWNSGLETLTVSDPDVYRFLSVNPDEDYSEFKTYAVSGTYAFAQFYLVENDVVVGGAQCPLVEGDPYYLVTQHLDGYLFYNGSASGGEFGGNTDKLSAKEVYVEYVTREVIS